MSMLKLNGRTAMALVSVSVMTAAIAGCGSASDPKAITIDELKYPGGLMVRDDGNGAATLFWTGTNNEEDFDGYNIYGMKADATIAALEGTPLELLSEEGEPSQGARDTLALFNYSPAAGFMFEKKAEPKEAGDKDFAALPVHALDGDKPLLPTCKNSGAQDAATGAYACGLTTKDTVGKDVDDDSKYSTNGLMSYAITGLTAGQKYCFLIMSSIKEGKKVSQTSSNVACVTPKKAFTLSAAMPSGSARLIFDMNQLVTTCATTPASCVAPTVSTTNTSILYSGTSADTADGKKSAYFNYSSDATTLSVESGFFNAIQDLGYYKNGFTDKSLPMTAPALTLDTAAAPIRNLSGYSLKGQSVLLFKSHMYVVAVADASATAAPAAHTYVWFYVKDTPSSGSTPTIEMRVPLSTNQR